MMEQARRERTARLLAHRLDELAAALERPVPQVGATHRLELASLATERAVALRLISERRAAAIWADAVRRHPVLRPTA